MADKSERFWDKAASRYDQAEKKDERTYIDIIKRTKAQLDKSDMVMDYGCGTGRITNEIAGHVEEIHAIDISSNMIGIAEKNAKERSIANIRYAHASIFDERFKQGSFDAVLVFHVLHLVEDERLALLRIHELLKPGGLLIAATPCVGEKPLLRRLLSLAGKIGLVPNIKAYTKRSLTDAIEACRLSIVEADCLKESSREYYMAARKAGDARTNN